MAQSLRFDKWFRAGFHPWLPAGRAGPQSLRMFQYNLKTLLLVMLGACILTWLFFVLPGEIGFIVLLCGMLIVPSAVLAGILYFRGYPQAFSIGCVPPLLLLGLFMTFEGPRMFRYGPGDDLEDKLAILVCLLVVLAAGAASAGVRWLAVWSQQPAIQTKTFPGMSIERAPATTTPRALNPEP